MRTSTEETGEPGVFIPRGITHRREEAITSVFGSASGAAASDSGADPPLPCLRLDQLQAFVTVAEELHFTRAARRMFLSQPGLSRRLGALETAVGCQLFQRTSKDVRLTSAGEAFLPFALKFIELGRECLPALQPGVRLRDATPREHER